MNQKHAKRLRKVVDFQPAAPRQYEHKVIRMNARKADIVIAALLAKSTPESHSDIPYPTSVVIRNAKGSRRSLYTQLKRGHST